MGCDKLLLEVGGSSLLTSAIERFLTRFDRVLASVADKNGELAAEASAAGALLIADIFTGCGPISGLHAALSEARGGDGVFLVAGDKPFSDPDAALFLIGRCGDADICVTESGSGEPEPLFGYYKKTLLPEVAGAIRAGRYTMRELLRKSRTRIVRGCELGALWSEELILNINRPEDYKGLLALEKDAGRNGNSPRGGA
jgi:molybdopterin-guanine dinucleotide biosynthesis protein A